MLFIYWLKFNELVIKGKIVVVPFFIGREVLGFIVLIVFAKGLREHVYRDLRTYTYTDELEFALMYCLIL